jgi:phage shock protein A
MKERLISRIGRLISGSFNSLVDTIENAAPESVMAEAIREVDVATDDVRAELGRVLANKHMAGNRLMEKNRKHVDLAEKIELAVKQGRDDLAEVAVAQQLDIEAQIPILEATIKACGDQEKELEGYINALSAKKREMQEELREYKKSRAETNRPVDSSAPQGDGSSGADVDNRVRRAESAFERIMEKATGLPGATGSGDRKTATQLAELESMAHKNRIQERLAAIKNQMDPK